MRTGAMLTEDRLDRYEPLGAFGQPVYRNHVQLQAALRQRLGAKYANFFALPQFDSQGRTVRWISPVEGEALRWSELSEEDQVARSLDLQVMKSEFDTYLTELRAYQNEGKEPRGAKAFVAVLEQALKTPNDGHLFFVGDQPVATFWGFKELDHPPFETLTAAPHIAPGQAGPAAAPPPPVGEAPRRFAWWWLLLPLLLLLLALLLWWFWPDDRTDDGFVVDRPAIEEPLEEPLPDAPIDRAADRTIVDGDGVVVDGDGVIVPGGEVDENGMPVTEGEAAADGTLPGDEETAGPNPDGEEPAGEEPGAEAETPPDEAAQPPAPEPGAEETPPEGEAPSADSPEPPASESPAPGEPPAIPDDAQDGAAGFMTGNWRSDSGLVDRQTKQKLTQEYKFDEDGKGETVIRRADGVTCRAPATAQVQGGRLQVEELENLKCDDGSAFRKSRTVCTRDASGKAECIGTDQDGNRYKVDLNRGGQP